MSRKSIPRSLPPPSEVFSRSELSDDCNKQSVVLEELRKAAKRLRKRKSQPFYSMRDITSYFKVSLRTVARVYETLDREGVLKRLRGAQTLLIGNADSTQRLVRGVIGFPVWLHAMVVSPFARALLAELLERMRQNGFVVDIIFFRTNEDCEPDFGKRLLQHNLNAIIWHTPHPLASDVRLFLQDHGVRQITIQLKESTMSMFPPDYLLDWQPAYQAMAKTWHNEGIREVFIPTPVYLPSQQAIKSFCKLLNESGIETRLVEGNASALLENVRGQHSKAVAFMDQQGADSLCNKSPGIMEEISFNARLAFCRGMIRIPYFEDRPIKVDVVGFSAVEMAERIAKDFCDPSSLQILKPHTFEAVYRARKRVCDIEESL